MKTLFTLLVLGSFLSSYQVKNNRHADRNKMSSNQDTINGELDEEIITMEVYPVIWLSNTPNWIEKSNLNNGDSLHVRKCFYLEAADSLEFPQISIEDYHFRVTGQFYKEMFCPSMIYDPENTGMNDRCMGKVFRFTEIDVIYHGAILENKY